MPWGSCARLEALRYPLLHLCCWQRGERTWSTRSYPGADRGCHRDVSTFSSAVVSRRNILLPLPLDFLHVYCFGQLLSGRPTVTPTRPCWHYSECKDNAYSYVIICCNIYIHLYTFIYILYPYTLPIYTHIYIHIHMCTVHIHPGGCLSNPRFNGSVCWPSF